MPCFNLTSGALFAHLSDSDEAVVSCPMTYHYAFVFYTVEPCSSHSIRDIEGGKGHQAVVELNSGSHPMYVGRAGGPNGPKIRRRFHVVWHRASVPWYVRATVVFCTEFRFLPPLPVCCVTTLTTRSSLVLLQLCNHNSRQRCLLPCNLSP